MLNNVWKAFIPIPNVYSFLVHGSYVVEVDKGLIVFSINTLYFSKDNPIAFCEFSESAGAKLLAWLNENLYHIAEVSRNAFLTRHIPPLAKNYKKQCLRVSLKMIEKYKSVIQGQFYGHDNTDDFAIEYGSRSPIGVALMSPAVATSMNPAFLVYQYDETSNMSIKSFVTDYTQYILNLKEANSQPKVTFVPEYSLKKTYHMKSLRLSDWIKLNEEIQKDKNNFQKLHKKFKYTSSF